MDTSKLPPPPERESDEIVVSEQESHVAGMLDEVRKHVKFISYTIVSYDITMNTLGRLILRAKIQKRDDTRVSRLYCWEDSEGLYRQQVDL